MPKLYLINQSANLPTISGHTRQYEIALGLTKLNWDVEIICSDFNIFTRKFTYLRPFRFLHSKIIEGVKWTWLYTFPYKKNNIFRYINVAFFSINVFLYLLKILFLNSQKDNKNCIIYASSPQLPAAWCCLLISKCFKIPFIFEVRDIWPQVLIELGGKSKNSIFIKILQLMEKQLYKHSDSVIVLSKGAKKHVKRFKIDNIYWLPNGADLNKFKFERFSSKQETKEKKFNIIYPGAFGIANGLDNVIEAAKILDKKNSYIHITLIGDGTEKERLKLLSKGLKNITFREPIPKILMPQIYSSSDVILVTLSDIPLFRYGVSPNKLYDAYASGRPVITTIPGFINDEINKNNIGFGIEPNNANLLADIMIKISEAPLNELNNMGHRSRLLAEKFYSREKIIIKLNKLLKNMLDLKLNK